MQHLLWLAPPRPGVAPAAVPQQRQEPQRARRSAPVAPDSSLQPTLLQPCGPIQARGTPRRSVRRADGARSSRRSAPAISPGEREVLTCGAQSAGSCGRPRSVAGGRSMAQAGKLARQAPRARADARGYRHRTGQTSSHGPGGALLAGGEALFSRPWAAWRAGSAARARREVTSTPGARHWTLCGARERKPLAEPS